MTARFQKSIMFFGYILLLLFSVFLVPPMQKPDEPTHFLKMIIIAETGHLFCSDSRENVPLPTSVVEIAMGTQSEQGETTTAYPNPCSLPFFYYLPSAAIISVLKLFHAPIEFYVYAGRLVHAFLFLLLGVISIRIVPVQYRNIVLLYLLFPIVWFQATSLSKDWTVFSFGLLFFCLYARFILQKKARPKEYFILIFVFLLLVLARLSYVPLAIPILFHLFSHKKHQANRKKYMIVALLVMIAFCVAIFEFWFVPKINQFLQIPMTKDGYYPSYQLQGFVQRPFVFWHHLHTTMAMQLIPLYTSGVGSLGWNLTPLPDYVYGWFLVVWTILAIRIRRNAPAVQIPGLLIGVLTSVLLLCVSAYVFTTAVDAPTIQGLQGRYFTPLVPFALLAFTKISKKAWIKILFVWGLFCVFSVISTMVQLYV